MALPHFEKLYKELGDEGLMFATVSTDSPDTARTFATHNKLVGPFLVDRREKEELGEVSTLFHRWKGEYIIDSTGTIVENFKNGISVAIARAALAKVGVK